MQAQESGIQFSQEEGLTLMFDAIFDNNEVHTRFREEI